MVCLWLQTQPWWAGSITLTQFGMIPSWVVLSDSPWPVVHHALPGFCLQHCSRETQIQSLGSGVWGQSPNPKGDPLSYLWIHAIPPGTGKMRKSKYQVETKLYLHARLASTMPSLLGLLPTYTITVQVCCFFALSTWIDCLLRPHLGACWYVSSVVTTGWNSADTSQKLWKSVLWISDNQYGYG